MKETPPHLADHEADAASRWERLPAELWREILLRCPSDYDLGACLCAARCFHVLSAGDLKARRYADATVEGMCAAGDLAGLEYALDHRAPSQPVDWTACICDAGARGHPHVVARLADHLGMPSVPPAPWEEARAIAVGCDDALLRAMAALPLAIHDVSRPVPASTIIDAMNRFDKVWARAPIEARLATAERCRKLGKNWPLMVQRFVNAAPGAPPFDVDRAGSLALADARHRQCQAQGDADGARVFARQLDGACNRRVVGDLVHLGRLAEAVSLASNPAVHVNLPYFEVAKSIKIAARAAAEAGRVDLLDALWCFDAATPSVLDLVTGGRHYKVWAAVVEAAAAAGHVPVLERAWEAPIRYSSTGGRSNALAAAVAAGRLDCVRWLRDRGCAAVPSRAWCTLWQWHASALSLALVARRTDMVGIILSCVDGEAAARRAFEEAVAAGGLRLARHIRTAYPSVLAPRAAARADQDMFVGMVFVVDGGQISASYG
ncbi:hypothetical protein [Pandoravirus japonicus]|uniref:Ankyrin repeat domain containing protein n=1 Tax=Pandoravirus japonicus TaxID=2823154 RepID=A0A811BRS8_9VIRU|nr:hypothetical protein [Pandoravirus japonicus]